MGQTLSIEKSDKDVQNNRQQNRKQTGSHDGKVKRATASFDANVAGQPSKGDS
jgi:hypothetical protein